MSVSAREVAQSVPEAFRRGPVVYFVGGEDGPVKIGFTTELPNRLRSLRNSSPHPIRLLVATHGDRQTEAEYHRRFAADRLHGEWFDRSEQIREEIAKLIWLPRVMFKFQRGRRFGLNLSPCLYGCSW